jgi:hypothetical protein
MRLTAAIAVGLALLQSASWAEQPLRAPSAPRNDPQLIVEITEDLLNRFITHRQTALRPVQDVILEAQVFGQEQTSTEVRLDFTPSRDGAAAYVRLAGRTNSDTMGYTPQAAVHTLADNSFSASKLVIFDGAMFRTQRPQVHVVPYSQPLCAATPADGTPLGPLFSGIALQIAQARRPEADRVIVDKISRRVGTEFNRDIDRQLATLNQGWLRQVRPWLVQMGWLPKATRASSTGEALHYAARFEDGLSLPPVPATQAEPRMSSQRNRIAIHESLVNFALASLNLEAVKFTPEQLDAYVQPAQSLLDDLGEQSPPGLTVPPTSPTPAGAAIQLDQHEPVRVEFDGGEIRVTLRASFAIPLGGATPLQVMELRYRFEPVNDGWRLAPADVAVPPAGDGTGQPDVFAAIIEQQVRGRVPELRLPRQIAVPSASTRVQLTFRDPVLQEGWLVLEVE